MRASHFPTAVVVVAALSWSAASRGANPPDYMEDFSGPTPPAWTTNKPAYFRWDSASGTYAATQQNVPEGGYYAYHDIGQVGPSFVLEWDINLHSVDYASGLCFGVFDPDLDSQSPSLLYS